MNAEAGKRQAAEAALGYVEPGMKLGLGTGSTAVHFVDLVGARVAGGLDVLCVPTSEATRVQAQGLGIPLTTLDDTPHLNLTVDGADELDDQLRLIKGGGGALLREKIVATASDRMIVIADDSKRVETLGRFPLPIEVVTFGLRSSRDMIEGLAATVGCEGGIERRQTADGQPFVTDGGNAILDCRFGRIPDPEGLAQALTAVPGVVEHGLFLGIATVALIAGAGGVDVLTVP